MNKLHLLHDAEKLYCIENLSPEMIAEKLNISRRTIFNWKKKHNWDNHIVRIKDLSKQFAGDIYNIGAKLLAKLNDDIDNNKFKGKIGDDNTLILKYVATRNSSTGEKQYKLFEGYDDHSLTEFQSRYYLRVLNLE